MNIKLLSLVIPAHKQEKTITKNIKSLDKILSSLPYKYELIIVVDGDTDGTYKKVKSLENRKIRVINLERNQGKGYAVRLGMMKAKGDVIGFIDAGMDINPVGISLLLNIMQFNNADIVIGSKLHPESKVKYPPIRRILSWGYRTLTATFFDLNVTDTQVGLKFFKRKVVKEVFPKLLIKKFAFDVEILAVAKARGFNRIFEGPVRLDFSSVSAITPTTFWKVILHMLWDTLAVFYRLKILHYYDK